MARRRLVSDGGVLAAGTDRGRPRWLGCSSSCGPDRIACRTSSAAWRRSAFWRSGLSAGFALGVVVFTARAAATRPRRRRRWMPFLPPYQTAPRGCWAGSGFRGPLHLLLLLAVVMLASLVLGWLFALLRGGVRDATRTVDDALAGLVAEATQVSPRQGVGVELAGRSGGGSPAPRRGGVGGLRDDRSVCGLV